MNDPNTDQARASHTPLERRLGAALLALLVVVLGVVILQAAWVTEDAYITFRVVDNFVNGYGLRWNVAERVQAYTHPLWLLLVSPFYLVTGEPYYTVIALSLTLTLGAILIASRTLSGPYGAIVALCALISSRAFIDYSTSGLENPLTYFLAAVFAAVFLKGVAERHQVLVLTLVAALAAVNRLDTFLLFAPALGWAYYEALWRRRQGLLDVWFGVCMGFVPLLLWQVFALVYYGFPFPNTAYAKLQTGIAASDLLRQGLYYCANLLNSDPVTVPALALGLFLAFSSRQSRPVAFALGVVLYVLYTVRIGGDFMAGRFFAAPLFITVILIGRTPLSARSGMAVAGILMALGLYASHPTLRYNEFDHEKTLGGHGIADERRYYYQAMGLLSASRGHAVPDHKWVEEGKAERAKGPHVIVRSNIGLLGYYAGPEVHIIDSHGLTDPFLARLPIPDPKRWRVGHYMRDVPPAYVRTLRAEASRFTDRRYEGLYTVLRTITRDPLFKPKRLREIARINLGTYNFLMRPPPAAEHAGP